MTKYYLVGRLSKDSIADMINELIKLSNNFNIYNFYRNVVTALDDYKKNN